jgi:hypothetical protein
MAQGAAKNCATGTTVREFSRTTPSQTMGTEAGGVDSRRRKGGLCLAHELASGESLGKV